MAARGAPPTRGAEAALLELADRAAGACVGLRGEVEAHDFDEATNQLKEARSFLAQAEAALEPFRAAWGSASAPPARRAFDLDAARRFESTEVVGQAQGEAAETVAACVAEIERLRGELEFIAEQASDLDDARALAAKALKDAPP